MRHRGWLAACVCALLAGPVAAETFEIDPAHSGVTFRVSHMMISKVSGHFDKFKGTVDYVKGKPQAWKTAASIETASINTKIEKRDHHLKSADFFDVEKYPEITFKSTKVAWAKGNKAKLVGDLSMHGVVQPVTLDLEIGGTTKDPQGNERLGAVATTKLSRKQFGLAWNKLLETGGAMVGDEVEITIEIEGIAKKT